MKESTVDVVVIGAGAAGLAAALTAAEAGAKVALLEKHKAPGAISSMLRALGTLRNDQAFKDRAFQVWMESSHWTANASLVRAFIEKSSQFQEWLIQHGAYDKLGLRPLKSTTVDTMGKMRGIGGGFPDTASIYDWQLCTGTPEEHSQQQAPAGYRWASGFVMLRVLMEEARRIGVEVHMSTRATKILMDKDRIIGVLAEDASGGTVQLDCQAVVVSTNGFHENPEMLKELGFEFDPYGQGVENGLSLMLADQDLVGDGIQMAEEAGADRGPVWISFCYNVPGPGILRGRMAGMTINQVRIIQDQPYLWVNQSGQRFIDETMSSDRVTMGNIVSKQRSKCVYLIFDEDTRAHLETDGPEWCYYVSQRHLPLTDIQGQFGTMIESGNEHVFMANSLEELAQQAGIDPVALRATVEQYNGFCERGHDDFFGKRSEFLRPVKQPPLYALRNSCWAYESIGGIRINEKGQALGKNLEPIPGLYAAGSIALGELFGERLDSAYGLVTIAWALGCIAADGVMEYVQMNNTTGSTFARRD